MHEPASLEDAAISTPPPPQHHGKRHQYAPSQTQAYYAGKTAVLDPTPSQQSVKQKRWPDWGLNPGPSRHIPDALTTELSGLYQQIN